MGHLRYSMALLKKIVSCQWSVVRKTGARPQVSSFEGTEKSRGGERFRRSWLYEGNRNFPFWESSCRLSVGSCQRTDNCQRNRGPRHPRDTWSNRLGILSRMPTSNKHHPPSIKLIVERFVLAMGSAEKSLLLAMRELARMHRLAHRNFDDFVATDSCDVSYGEDGSPRYRPKSHDFCEEFGRVTSNLDTMHVADRLVPRSFLVSLVSQYDAFVRLLLSALLLNNPNILKSSHKTAEVSELLRFDTIQEAYEWLVEQQIDEAMRKSHSEQFDFIESTFNVKWIRDDDSLWQAFIEVTERRNLFTHTDGIVSDQYLQVCRKNSVKLENGAVKGAVLTVSPQYSSALAKNNQVAPV